MDPKDKVDSIKSDFDGYVESITKLLRLCYEALSPTATQRQRLSLRDAIKAYLDKKS